jgi:hypothetical protein
MPIRNFRLCGVPRWKAFAFELALSSTGAVSNL